MNLSDSPGSPREADTAAADVEGADDGARVREMFAQHFDFIWRSLRRFGLSDDAADDATQQVFIVASRKLEVVRRGSERSFLFGTAMRVAADHRRSAPQRREIAHADPGADLEGGPRPDDLLDQRRARQLLDEILDCMDLELRSVFVLYELEEMTTVEIASLLEIPHGTVASRLRRARDELTSSVERLKRRFEQQRAPSDGEPQPQQLQPRGGT